MNRPLSTLVATLLVAGLAPLGAQDMGAKFSNLVDAFIELPYSPALVPQTGITFEAWITYDETTIGTGWRYPTLMRQGNSGGGSENMFLRVNAHNTNTRQIAWKVVTASNSVTCTWPFAAGQLLNWTHIAGTYDQTGAKLFVNGVQVASVPGNGQPIRDTNNQTLRIGKGDDIGTPMEVWNGEVDEVRLWPFARTQAEIQATMNQRLSGVAGGVATWNLDGHSIDTSGGMIGNQVGAVTFQANTLALASVPLPFPIGLGTPGCLGDLRLAPTSAASLGNSAFAVVCTRAPANATVAWGITTGVLPSPIVLEGALVWLDLVDVILGIGGADALGVSRAPIPIPATAPLGFTFAIQAAPVDPCGPFGFTTSDATIVQLVP
ncbi:MAG: LamG domain-containing protein [Planctomycetes bacterium]|nr:LamG domain-containing protein [Planctomycetota bacterium]